MKLTAYFLLFVGLSLVSATPVPAQTATLTKRGEDGKLQVRRQNQGAYLGVYLGNDKSGGGALVGKVIEGSPAAAAGIEANDVLLEIGAQPISKAAHVYQWLANAKPATSATIRLRRKDAEKTLAVQLGERPLSGDDPCQKLFSEANALLTEGERMKAMAAEAARKGDAKAAEEDTKSAETFFKQAELTRLDVEKAIAEGRAGTPDRLDGCLPSMLQPEAVNLGLEVMPLSPQLAKHFGVPANSLLVAEIKPGGLAQNAGLRAGDCLTRLNDKVVQNSFDLKQLTDGLIAGKDVSFSVYREGKALTLITKK